MKLRILGIAIVTLCVGFAAQYSWHAYGSGVRAETITSQAPDPLADLNDAFRAVYRQARADLLTKAGPVVVVTGDNLVLLRGGQPTDAKPVTQSFHDLKAISHIPLGIAMLLVPGSEQELPQEKLDQLRRFRDQVVAAQAVLNKRFEGDVLKRNRLVVRSCLDFLEE